MKKILCVFLLVALCTSCSSPSLQSSQPVPASSVSVDTTDDASAVEKTIVPILSSLKIDSITDATVTASFEPKDLVTASGETPSLQLTVYEYELFDIVDISTLAVGDTIVVSQKNIKVESLEKKDSGLILVNGGEVNEGVEFCANNDNVYFETGMDGTKRFNKVGQATFKFNDNFKFIDNSDLDKPNQEFTYDEFAEKLQNEQISFIHLNATVLIQNGEIAEITLSYIP